MSPLLPPVMSSRRTGKQGSVPPPSGDEGSVTRSKSATTLHSAQRVAETTQRRQNAIRGARPSTRNSSPGSVDSAIALSSHEELKGIAVSMPLRASPALPRTPASASVTDPSSALSPPAVASTPATSDLPAPGIDVSQAAPPKLEVPPAAQGTQHVHSMAPKIEDATAASASAGRVQDEQAAPLRDRSTNQYGPGNKFEVGTLASVVKSQYSSRHSPYSAKASAGTTWATTLTMVVMIAATMMNAATLRPLQTYGMEAFGSMSPAGLSATAKGIGLPLDQSKMTAMSPIRHGPRHTGEPTILLSKERAAPGTPTWPTLTMSTPTHPTGAALDVIPSGVTQVLFTMTPRATRTIPLLCHAISSAQTLQQDRKGTVPTDNPPVLHARAHHSFHLECQQCDQAAQAHQDPPKDNLKGETKEPGKLVPKVATPHNLRARAKIKVARRPLFRRSHHALGIINTLLIHGCTHQLVTTHGGVPTLEMGKCCGSDRYSLITNPPTSPLSCVISYYRMPSAADFGRRPLGTPYRCRP